MKANVLAELIERQYYGGDVSDDAGLERIDFIEHVYAAYAYLVQLNYYNNIKMTGDRGLSNQYIKTYTNVPVVYNEEQDLYYSELPASPITLPNNIGVYMISKMQSPNKPFSPIGIGELFLYSGLPTTQYSFDNENVYYYNIEPEVKSVKMLIVASRPDEIQDDDVHEIKEMVLKQLMITRNIPEDKANDSNPNIITPNGK